MKQFTFDFPINTGPFNCGFLRVSGDYSAKTGTFIRDIVYHNEGYAMDVMDLLQVASTGCFHQSLYCEVKMAAENHTYNLQTEAA